MSDIDNMFDEPSEVPAAPSRPVDNSRIMGMPADTWAVGIERKIDKLDAAQRERLDEQSANFGAFKSEVLDVLKRVVDVLERQERQEHQLRDHRVDINANTSALGTHDDQIAALKRDVAAHSTEIEKLKRAAVKRLRKP